MTMSWFAMEVKAARLAEVLWEAPKKWWNVQRCRLRRPARSLRLQESLPLGEKRFVAIVVCGEQRLLIGGAPNAVSLLTVLPPPLSFRELLTRLQPEGRVR